MRIAGVLFFDDADQLAPRIAQDAPVASGLIEVRREQGQRGASALVALDHRAQSLFADQRHIAAQNQHVAGKSVKRFFRAKHRLAGAELPFLDDPGHAVSRTGPLHRLGAVADYNGDFFGSELLRRVEHMQEKRFAAERVEHFGQVGFHPSSLPGSQKNDA